MMGTSEARRERDKIVLMAILLVGACLLTYFFHEVLKYERFYTHLFYIPIILASFWWKRRGIIVSLFLAGLVVFSHILFRSNVPIINDFLRASVFVAIGIFAAILSERIARARRSLRENEDRFSVVLQNSRDMVYRLDPKNGKFDYVSPSAIELTGFTPKEITLMGLEGVIERIDPEDKDRFMAHFENVLKQTLEDGLAPTIEYRWKHKEGEYRWFSDNRAVVRDDDGNPVSIIGNIRDVTEEKRAEWALRESEQKYRTLIETAQEGVAITSPGEEFVFVNRAFASILGYEPSELVGRNLREFVAGEQFDTFQTETGKREWGISSHYETELRHRDGSHRSVLVSASPLYDREDNYQGALGMVVDITERKKAEEGLRESEEKFRNLAEQSPNMIFINKKGRVVYANKKCEELMDYKREDFYSPDFDFLKLISPECADLVRERFSKHIKGEDVAPYEYTLVTKEGRRIEALFTSTLIVYEGESAILGIVTDITERKKVEEALRESEEFSSNLLGNSPNPMLVINEDSSVRYVNPALEKLTGFSSAEVVGAKAPYPWWTEETLQKTSGDLRDAMRKGAKRLEELFQKKDGERFWVEITSVPVRSNGKLRYYLSNWVDITERKKAEQALLESEEKYRLVSENIPVVVYSALPDEHSTNVLVTGKILGLTGYSDEQFMEDQQLSGRIVHPEDREHVWKRIEEHREKKIALDVEYRIITKDNTVKWIRDRATPMVDENGQLVRIDGFMEDITERKRAEESLAKSEAFLNATGRMAKVGGWEVDARTLEVRWTDETYRIHEVPVEHKPPLDEAINFFHPEDRPKLEQAIQRALEHGEPYDMEIRFITATGKHLWTHTICTPQVEDGKTVKLTGTFQDITERKRAEEALRESEEKLDAMLRSIGDHMSMMDEDLNILWANEVAKKLFGNDIIGKKCYEVYHQRQEPCEPYPCLTLQAFRDGKAHEHDTQVIDKDGRMIYFHCKANVALRDKDRKPTAVIEISSDITERKKAEEALAESEERYRAIWENSPTGISLTDEEGVYHYVNPAYCEIYGYSREQLIGRPYYELIVRPEEREERFRLYKQKFHTGTPVPLREVEFIRSDGEPIWIQFTGDFVRQNHSLKYLVSMNVDITERKRAEEALQESEAKWRSITENSPDHIMLLDREANIQFFNQTVPDLTKEQVIGTPIYNYVPEDYRPVMKESFERVMKTGQPDQYEVEYKSADGSTQVYETSVGPVLRGDEVVALTLSSRDITERKKGEEAIRHSEEQLRALFDSAADIVFTKDREGRYTRVNSACARLHSLSEKEFIGKTDFDLFPEEPARHSSEIDRQVLVEGRTFTGEYDRQIRGKTLTLSIVKTPLHGPDGSTIGLCGIARDMTEQRSLEEQFRQAQKMESLGTLAGGVAHDFNNLLGGVLGYVSLIKGDYSPGEKHYAMLELVEKAGVRAAELTNQLLAFSRKGKFELRAVNLNNSVEDVLRLIGRTLDKSIEIATELQEELRSVEGDPGQLEQAILNLCVNAAEAMPGGGKLKLETRVVALGEEFARKYLGSDPGDYVLLSVSDTGVGMDSETLSRMFEPFFTTKEVGRGTGLGLSTVYGIVKNHGGYVDVRSQPGKGSTFDIYLPVSKKQFTPPRPRAAELQTGHETILAVDDEEIIRSLLEETLQKLGYKVILANDGEEAVQIYEERKDEIDAVIIDMIMPHLGGRETFREIKRRNPDVRVLLVSGFSQDGAAQRILDEGVKGFIQKPFELVELSQKLRQVLD